MLDWLKHTFRTRYVALLEEEVDRLRAENRALVNSLLGTAGFPPVNLPESAALSRDGRSTPIRRRSWQQFQAEREFESGRKAK